MDRAFQHLEGRLDRLLFVTSDKAKERGFEAMANWLEPRVGGRLLTLAGTPEGFLAATDAVRDKLQADQSIEGVVILGDYESVPSQPKLSVPESFLTANNIPQENAELEPDLWMVWTDDLYGDRDGDEYGRAAIPVSRLPLVPRQWLYPEEYMRPDAYPAAIGRSANQFKFTAAVYADCLDPEPASPIAISPSAALYPPQDASPFQQLSNELVADRVYLVLHGDAGTDVRFKGTTADNSDWDPIVVDLPAEADVWQTPAIVFAGVCWGALITPIMAVNAKYETSVTAEDVSQSIALSLLDRGAQAFVGFTALHKIPGGDSPPHLFGEPLHRFFWDNIRSGMPPARALFHAKASYLDFPPREGEDPLSIAFDMKTFWSVTCLGFGW